MDGPSDYLAKRSKSDIERQLLHGITYMWNLKNNINEIIYKRETDLEIQKMNLPKRKGWGKNNLEVWN